MSASDPGLRRVTVHADNTHLDLCLPATVPVAALIPPMADLLGGVDATATRYRLSRLDGPTLPNSTTLAQNDIRDGSVLLLSRESPTPPSVRCDDEAHTVAAVLTGPNRAPRVGRITAALAAGCLTAAGALVLVYDACHGVQHAGSTAAVAAVGALAALISAAYAHRASGDPTAGLTLSVIAVMFAAVAGLLAVPGIPGAPNVLLASMAAAVAAVLSIRSTGCAAIVLTAMAAGAVIGAGAALTALLTGARPHVIGALTALCCLCLLEAAPRMSMLLAGLSPGLGDDDPAGEARFASKALSADRWLSSLSIALAAAAGAGADLAALHAPRAIALSAVTAVLLLLHTRRDRRRALTFTTAGVVTMTITFVIGASSASRYGPWIAALTAVLAGTALYAGFVAPGLSLSPVARRTGEAFGCLTLVAVVPLTCWTCGAFDAIRGLNLTRT